jgi:hypothetical protein
MAGQPVERLQAPADPSQPQVRFGPPGSAIGNDRHPLTKPGVQMRGWLDEVTRKLTNREKDNDDNPDI